MEGSCHWKTESQGMEFEAHLGSHRTAMDAKPPVGRGNAATPKQLLLAAITGCTAMDVIGYLKKHRELPTDFKIHIATEDTTTHPVVFKVVNLKFELESQGAASTVLDGVTKSMTQYCGVSAMLSKACPINYEVHLNGNLIGKGQADFSA